MKDEHIEELARAIVPHIEDRRTVRRFIGRRSIDKTHGEVVHDLDPFGAISDETMKVVERLPLANFVGEVAAVERAGELGDEWTATVIAQALAPIIDRLVSEAREEERASFSVVVQLGSGTGGGELKGFDDA